MGQKRKILERLDQLERRWHERDGGHGHGCCDHHHCDDEPHHHHGDHHHGHGGDFDEKRVIDTIVSLVSEHVGQMLAQQQAANRNRDESGNEKRIVDLIVGCVSEHVREIVATELDRRLGRPDVKGGEAPSRPRGGSSEAEPA